MRFQRRDPSFLTRWFFQTDRAILYTVFILIGIGIYMLIAAGGYAAARIGQPPLYFFIKAMLPLFFGLGALFIFSCLNKKQIIWLGAILGIVGAALVFATLVSPTCIKGSCRFFTLPGVGQIHPSELLKPFFILFTAIFLASKPKWNKFGWPMYIIIAGAIIGTILVRKDLGMTLIYLGVFSAMLYFANAKFRILVGIGVGVAGLGAIAFATMSHVRNRIMGTSDPFQINKALDSIRNGGFTGKLNSSFVKSDLPDIHTDFVFAAFVEDWGVIFGIALLAIYLYLMTHILNLMRGIDDMATRLVCGGVFALLGMHLVLNIGTTLNLTPAKGTILPFVSYGGSAFISCCAVFGIMLGMVRSYKFDREVRR